MADCFSNYLRDKINDHLHGGPDFTRPATTFFALMTVMPTASGGGTEALGGTYARVAVTNNSTNWPASSGQAKANGVAISWGVQTTSLGTIVGIAEYDAATGGNLLTFQPLNTAVAIAAGQPFDIPAGGGVFNWA